MNPEPLIVGALAEHHWRSDSVYTGCTCGVEFSPTGIREWRLHQAAAVVERLERYGWTLQQGAVR